MIKDEIKQVQSIDLSELYPNLERGMPVTSKLRTLLRQIDLKIATQQMLQNNSYLTRLLNECKLFLPEMFHPQWSKNWGFSLAGKVQGGWVRSILDLMISTEQEVRVVDWSGIEINPIAIAQTYLLCQKLDLAPDRVSIISLASNDLKSDLRIKFVRNRVGDNDFVICEQELRERLELYKEGKDLRLVLQPEPEANPLLDLDRMPEVVID